MPMIEKPMNPYATEDFANAVKEAMKDVVEEVKHNYNEFPKDESKVIPHLIWDMPTKYCGIVRLPTSALWETLVGTLVDNGYGMFLYMLEYKLAERGKHFVKVDRCFPSSQLCSCCGYKNPAVKDLKVREWVCPECGVVHDRDHNAAVNILNEGLKKIS